MLGRHRGRRRGGRRHRRGYRRRSPYPYGYGYGYGYDPYWNYSNYREPPYVIARQPQQPQQSPGHRLGLQIPTIAVSLLLSYLLWGKRAG
jgi:hypothetical protein